MNWEPLVFAATCTRPDHPVVSPAAIAGSTVALLMNTRVRFPPAPSVQATWQALPAQAIAGAASGVTAVPPDDTWPGWTMLLSTTSGVDWQVSRGRPPLAPSQQ